MPEEQVTAAREIVLVGGGYVTISWCRISDNTTLASSGMPREHHIDLGGVVAVCDTKGHNLIGFGT